MTLKEAYKDLLEQLLTALRAVERCKGEALANKKMNIERDYENLILKVIGTAKQLADLLELSEGEIEKLSNTPMSTIREY